VYLCSKGVPNDRNLDIVSSVQSPYNCAIVGSSRTHNAVDPKIIDSQCSDFDVVAYNLGRPGRGASETYATVIYILNHAPTIKYILVELQDLNTRKNNSADIFAPQIQGFTVDYAWRRLRHMHPAPTYQNVMAFATNSFKLKSAFRVRPFYKYNKIEEYAGYRPLNASSVRKGKVRRRQSLLADPPDVELYKRTFTGVMRGDMPDVNEEYANALVKLAKLAEMKGVQVYYYLPYAIANREVLKCIPVLERIPSEYIVGAYHDPKWADLFDLDYHWDNGHLNQRGSRFFTEMLGKHLELKIQAEKNR